MAAVTNSAWILPGATENIDSDGSNFYIAGEYMKMDTLYARDRWSPYNTADWSSICGPSGSCLPNLNWNGVTAEDELQRPNQRPWRYLCPSGPYRRRHIGLRRLRDAKSQRWLP